MGKFDFLCRFMSTSGRKVPIVPLQQFNKAGNRILTREVLPLNSRALKGIDIPLKTHSAERLVVEKRFGKQSVEIISFKDKNGSLINRYRNNYLDGQLTDSSSSRYNIAKAQITADEGNGLLRVGDKQVQYFDSSGNFTSMDRIKTDIVQFENQSGRHVSRMQYKSAKNADGNFDGQFSVFHRFADNITNEINMSIIHSADGKLLSKQFGRVYNISDKVMSDPYLVTRAMPDEFAIKNLADRFSNIYDHSNKSLNIHFNSAKDALAEGGHYMHPRNSMYANLTPDLSRNVNTISHELRHKKQDEYADKFWKQLWYKLTNNKRYNKREFRLASYFKYNGLKYNILPHNHLANENSIMYKLYRNNGIEADAYRMGSRYEIDYQRRTEEFRKHFQYMSKYNRCAVESDFING